MSSAPTILRILFDYDGTLTYEEAQADALRQRSLDVLAQDILRTPRAGLEAAYWETQRRLLAEPARHGWMVGGQMAAYCDEGAFLLNTAVMQALLGSAPAARAALAQRFAGAAEPIQECVNWLFHSFTSDLPVAWRPATDATLRWLLALPGVETVVLTNSKGDKVARRLAEAGLPLLPLDAAAPAAGRIRILGDVRQYDMDAENLPGLPAALWAGDRPLDLRRPTYYRALLRQRADTRHLWVVADGLSLAGALPLALGIPFFLARAAYTPAWAADGVMAQPAGGILDDLAQLQEHVQHLLEAI